MRQQETDQIVATMADVNAPIQLSSDFGPVEMLLLSREQVNLREQAGWDTPGVYLLISSKAGKSAWSYSAYVGQSRKALTRISNHIKTKKDWHRACIIRKRGAGETFSTAQISWLEGRLWSLIKASRYGETVNRVTPGDETLPPIQIAALEKIVTPITNMLRLALVDITPEEGAKNSTVSVRRATKRTRKTHSGTLQDLFDQKLIFADQPVYLVFREEVTQAVLTVRRNRIGIEIEGKHHSAPSAASFHVRGTQVNGWYYWRVKDERGSYTSLGELRARLRRKSS